MNMDGDGNSSRLMDDDPPPPPEDYSHDFNPNHEIVADISSCLQVNPKWVVQACYRTQKQFTNIEQTREEIFAYVLENHPRFVELAPPLEDTLAEADDGETNELKMVLVINNEINMGAGKMAAQVAHAAVDLYAILIGNKEWIGLVQKWKEEGAKKVVVACKDTEHLFDLKDDAINAGLKCAYITDAGLTQVPSASVTCLAVFGLSSNVNKVTGTLKLV